MIILGQSTVLSVILVYVLKWIGLDLLVKIFIPVKINLPFPVRLFGLVISILGFFLIIWANYILLAVNKIGLKEREPYGSPSSLAITGPYQYTRNPIYLGALVALLGLVFLFVSVTILIINFLIYLLFRHKFVSWEEIKLEELFGKEYMDYQQKVRRWL